MMKRLSRLTALLLAIALLLCAFAGAWAEETAKQEAITKEEYEAALAAAMAAFPKLTPEKQYAFLTSLNGNDELIDSYLSLLSEEQIAALAAYIAEAEGYEVPKTVVFTDAGPFLPPVNVGRARMLRAAAYEAEPAEGSNGLEMTKTATANEDGTYTIRLEAYTTGKVTTTTKTIPVDIVLVLDQSGSMAYDFDGKSTNTNTDRRQYAMKQAVNNFIGSVAEKYSNEADHRISIVTFGKGASTLQGWTYVNDTGKETLQGKISSLPDSPSGATNVAAGMSQADNLMGSGYGYTGTNTMRQKVVVVFTDGVPTNSANEDVTNPGQNFSTIEANQAINYAVSLKNNDATIYSVGIFKGADPNKIHGDYYYRALVSDTPCDGSVNSYWGTTNLSGSNANDFADPDVPAGNRFLNYISNNYTANNIGLKFDDSDGLLGGYKWIITANHSGSNAGYYLTADNSTDLNDIFKEISDNIQTANIDLGSETVIRDIVSDSFEIPENAGDIRLYTAAAKADGTFEAPTRIPDNGSVTAVKTGEAGQRTVEVTGFDFNANFVSDTLKTDGTYGKKLVIEFDVRPRDGFLGGNDVFTNTSAGVYENSSATDAVETFVRPQVNVPIEKVTVSAADKNVYLFDNLTAGQLKEGTTVKCGNVSLDLSQLDYGLEDWQTEYVNISVEVKDKDGNSLTDEVGLSNLSDDTTYSVSVTVSPKENGEDASGTPATVKSGFDDGYIYVFRPVLTFKDSTVDYLSTYSDYQDSSSAPFDSWNAYYAANNYQSLVWKHGDIIADGVTMLGTEPTLTLTYTALSSDIDDTGKVISTTDVPIKVQVYVGEGDNKMDATGHTTFVHTSCAQDQACGWNETVLDGDPAFLLHVVNVTGELTIEKEGLHYISGDDCESALFTVAGGGKTFTVAINGNGSVTLNLPAGEYTVTEQTNWTWRYASSTDPTDGKVTVPGGGSASVTFTNTPDNTKWLGGDNYKKNVFSSSSN